MTDRSVDELLGDLGRRLEAAARVGSPRRRRRRLRGARRTVLIVAAVLLAAGSTAAATRSVWAPSTPGDRGPGGPEVRLATGTAAGVVWWLAARRCADGSVATFLRVGAAGAGRVCGGKPSPVGTYYDPARNRTSVFGLVPATARFVRVGLRGTPPGATAAGVTQASGPVLAADAEAVRRGGLAARGVVVVTRAGAWTPVTLTAQDANGMTVWSCEEARCAAR
jgi:hypothetical protein